MRASGAAGGHRTARCPPWCSGLTCFYPTLQSLGGASAIEVGFQYRDITGLDTHERRDTWQTTPLSRRTAPGDFAANVSGLQPARTYEFRALAKNSLLTVYGQEVVLK